MFQHTVSRVNNYILLLALLVLVTLVTHDYGTTVIALSLLVGIVVTYLLCLYHVKTLQDEHDQRVDRLFSQLDAVDDQLEDTSEELAYEKTRDTLFDNVIDTIRLSADPKAIAAMVAAYDLLRDEKDRYIRIHTSQRLQDLEAMQHPVAPDAAPCTSPT